MVYDYSELRGKVRARYGTQEAFAAALGISEASLSAKLNNRTDWDRAEIVRACDVLDIPLEQAHLYFFTPETAKTQFCETANPKE